MQRSSSKEKDKNRKSSRSAIDLQGFKDFFVSKKTTPSSSSTESDFGLSTSSPPYSSPSESSMSLSSENSTRTPTPPDTLHKLSLQVDHQSIQASLQEPFATYESFALYPEIWNETGAYLKSLVLFLDVEALLKKPYLSSQEYQKLLSRDAACQRSQFLCGLNLAVQPLVEILLSTYHAYKKEHDIAEEMTPTALKEEILNPIAKAIGCAVNSLEIGDLTTYDKYNETIRTHAAHSELIEQYYHEHLQQLQNRVNRAVFLFQIENLPKKITEQSYFKQTQERYNERLKKFETAFKIYDKILREAKKDPAFENYLKIRITGNYISSIQFTEKWRQSISSQIKNKFGLSIDEKSSPKINQLLESLSITVIQTLSSDPKSITIYFKHTKFLGNLINQLTQELFLKEQSNTLSIEKQLDQKFNSKPTIYEKQLKEIVTALKTEYEKQIDLSPPTPITERPFEFLTYPTPEMKELLSTTLPYSNSRNSTPENFFNDKTPPNEDVPPPALNSLQTSNGKKPRKLLTFFSKKTMPATPIKRPEFRRSLSTGNLKQ